MDRLCKIRISSTPPYKRAMKMTPPIRCRYTRPIKAAWDREADDNVTELSADRTRELGEVRIGDDVVMTAVIMKMTKSLHFSCFLLPNL